MQGVVSVVLASLALAARVAGAAGELTAPIVNGTPTSAFPTTGIVQTAVGLCSGVLIGCRTFLTAAHCFCDPGLTGAQCQGTATTDPSQVVVFLQHTGFLFASEVQVNPSFVFDDVTPSSTGDLTVVTLDAPVNGLSPTPINTTATPAPGTTGTIAGFGSTGLVGGVDVGVGFKRFGAVTTASCSPGLVCWNFTGPGANTCHGDSGGPLFTDVAGSAVVSGVTSGGTSGDCSPLDASFDADVYTYRGGIQGVAGADLASPTCGALPQVGQSGTAVFGGTGSFDVNHQSTTYAFGVSPNTQALRLALNGTFDGEADLYVRAGAPPTAGGYDCASRNAASFESCEFPAPTPGTWYATVQGVGGTGDYQVTVTEFGGDPAVCGNGIQDTGEECDGAAAGACTAGCTGQCTCLDCPTGDLTVETVNLSPRFSLKGTLSNARRQYDAIDPRPGFAVTMTDANGARIAETIPAGDRGWRTLGAGRSYRWRGNVDGLRRIKLRHRTGAWKIQLTGRNLSGASTLVYTGLRVMLTAGDTCVAKTF